MRKNKKNLRILHAPSETAGQGWLVSRAQRKLGYNSDNVVYRRSVLAYPADKDLQLSKKQPFRSLWKLFRFFFSAIKTYDMFHFYFGHSLLPFYLDLPILRLLRKRVFFTYQGSDIRRRVYCTNDFSEDARKECDPTIFLQFKKYLRVKIPKIFAHHCFVLNPDLLDCAPQASFLAYAIDPEAWSFSKKEQKKDDEKPYTFLHIPTNKNIKGTKYVLAAYERLKQEGYNIELKMPKELIPYSEMKDFCADVDIVIDQLLIGWYGGFAVEMMAMQKSVICYLKEEDLVHVPWADNIPLINANQHTIYEKMKWAIEHKEEVKKIAVRGPEFVKKTHDPKLVAQQIITYYQRYL